MSAFARRISVFRSVAAASLAGLALTAAARAQDAPAQAALVAELEAAPRGGDFTLALELRMAPSWHVYWSNPGVAGYPPTIEWVELPEGIEAGPLRMPAPRTFEFFGERAHGYEGATLFLVDFTWNPGAARALPPDAKLRFRAGAKWLACDDESCVPGAQDLELILPLAAAGAAPRPGVRADDFTEARSWIPHRIEGWEVTATDREGSVGIQLGLPERAGTAADGTGLFQGLGATSFIFPTPAGATVSKWFSNPISPSIIAVLTDWPMPEDPRALHGEGFVVTDPGGFPGRPEWGRAVELRFTEVNGEAVGGGAATAAGDPPALEAAPMAASGAGSWGARWGLTGAMAAAFVGGMLLNLMPCVFPAISLKVIGFVEQAGGDRRRVLAHGLAFAVGVVASFLALAALLLALRAAGGQEGWGFQLQRPWVVLGFAALMTLIALNLWGLWEFGMRIAGAAGDAATRTQGSGLRGSFFSGALATALATPCTAPFMAGAIGWALAAGAGATLGVFLALGLGMAAPYVALSASPAWLARLPRPGAWMESFRQAMGFPMAAAAAWLVSVFAALRGADAAMWALWALIAMAIAGWAWGRGQRSGHGGWGLSAALSVGAAVALGAVALGAADPGPPPPGMEEVTVTDGAALDREVAKARVDGRPVFIDFTAKWCLTCRANKPTIRSERVRAAFTEHRVVVIEADWTAADPGIAQWLARHDRAGVPLYLLLPPEPNAAPITLPQILTPGIIIKSLDRL